MKRFLLLFSIVFAFLFSQAQTTEPNSTSDIIWLSDSSTIKDCKVNEIKDGNIVFFIFNGEEKMTEAIAVKWNDQYLNLKEHNANTVNEIGPNYKGHNYDYYHVLHLKAQTQRNVGIGLTAGGLLFYIVGVQMATSAGYNEHTEEFDDEEAAARAGLVIIGGAIMITVGIPLWISGGIKNSNNKLAMAKCKQPNMSLKFGGTKNGLGLVLNF